MHAIVWILSGLLAGWLARVVTRGPHIGFLGYVALGFVGSVSGAWLLRGIGGRVPSSDSPAHILVALAGAIAVVGLGRLAVTAAEQAGRMAQRARVPVAIPEIEAQLHRLGEIERRIVDAVLRRQPSAQDSNKLFQARLTVGQRVADKVAEFGGSWPFLGLFAAFMLAWMFLNTTEARPFDPYPFILLNLVLSCLAAVQAPVIMMSQNRQAARDRFEAQQDYQVNLRSETEIMALHQRLEDARQHDWRLLIELARAQENRLDRIERALAGSQASKRPSP